MMAPLRFLDIGLVLATAPFVALAGLPLLGYAIGAGAWIITRLGVLWLERLGGADPRARVGYQVAGMMGRVWIVVCAVVAARVAGGRDDGIMAAALLLAAFTVY